MYQQIYKNSEAYPQRTYNLNFKGNSKIKDLTKCVGCFQLEKLYVQRSININSILKVLSPWSQNKKKLHREKYSLQFRKWNFLALILKDFLYFPVFQETETLKSFLYFGKWNF